MSDVTTWSLLSLPTEACSLSPFQWVLWRPVHVTFVESVCRVRSLSLSGQILYRLADDVIVQWPELLQRYPRALYMGRLV